MAYVTMVKDKFNEFFEEIGSIEDGHMPVLLYC